MSSSLVLDINAKLEVARKAYYAGDPIMADPEFDALETQLAALVGKHPEHAHLASALTSVGTSTPTGARIKHVRPMLSIENQYTKDDVVAFYRTLPAGSRVNIEPKRDGISAELKYVDGKLVQAVTRGTGTEGEDMTAQVLALRNVPKDFSSAIDALNNPKALPSPSELRIRGELVMRDSELDRINKEALAKGQKTYASTRNLTAGTMKQRDLTVVTTRDIRFQPWDVYSPNQDDRLPDSNSFRMSLLNAMGFDEYEGYTIKADELSARDEIIKGIDTVLADNAKSDVRADGVVVKVDSHKLRKELGVASKFTNWMTCFKPQSASGTTYLRRIIWQGGRSGKLTPVAECDPVVLAGAVVTRATLNNETWIATMGLKVGAKVEMLRSGDVIPQIVKVLDDTGEGIIPPTECPDCNSDLIVYTDKSSKVTTRWCESGSCPGRIRDLFSYVGSREILEIDGLADDMATKLVQGNFARNLGELFEFQVDAMRELSILQVKYGEEPGEARFLALVAKQGLSVTVLRMLHSMDKAKTGNWDKWIAALGIPMVGRTLGKLLAKELKLGADDMGTLCTKLEESTKRNIEGMGEVKSDILKQWALDPVNRSICEALHRSGVRPKPLITAVADGVGQPLAGVSFCITGEFGEDREKLTQKLESLGATAKSGVSKKLNLLICGSNGGKSKLVKAENMNIQVVKEDWLENTFTTYGIEFKTNSGFNVEEV